MDRQQAPICWTITPALLKELRDKAAIRRNKVTLPEQARRLSTWLHLEHDHGLE
ncbi:MAG: hypothetical protein WCI65_06015 [Synechococcaceae cyanobacterium ELA263]